MAPDVVSKKDFDALKKQVDDLVKRMKWAEESIDDLLGQATKLVCVPNQINSLDARLKQVEE